MRKPLRLLMVLLTVLLAAVLVFGVARYLDSDAESQQPEATETQAVELQIPETVAAEPVETEPQTEPQPERFLLTFVGDCTLGCRDSHSYMDFGFTHTIGEDYGFPFRYVLEYFEKDELTCINLEGAFTDVGNPAPKEHTFRGPTSYINILTQNSVEFVTLANNHTMDYGKVGYESTITTLQEANIPYVERDCSAVVTTENGLRVGFYGAVYYLMETEVIVEAIRQLRQEADIVVFVPHWGFETNPHRNEDQVELAHAVIDAGADIVWGSHPHVLQEMESYNGGIIYYSLGNFSFGGNIYPGDYDSALVQQEVIRAADGSVSLGETIVVPVRISTEERRNNFQPIPYEEGSEDYLRVLEKLALIEKN